MTQEIIVGLIVVAALVYVVFKLRKGSKGGGCGCGCDSCSHREHEIK